MIDFVWRLVFKKVFKKNEVHALQILRNQSSKTIATPANLVDNAL